MKLCLIILSVPWYMFNGLEHTAILSHFLTFITRNCVRVGSLGTSCKFNPVLVSGVLFLVQRI